MTITNRGNATLKGMLRYLAPRKPLLIVVFLLVGISTLFNVVAPVLFGMAITLISKGGAGSRLALLLLGLGGIYLLSALASYLQQYIMASVSQKIVFDLRRDVDHKLSRLPLKFFDSQPHGEILSKATNDMDSISATLLQGMTQLSSAILTFVGIVVMMLAINTTMAAICLLTVPLCSVLAKVILARSQKYFAAMWDDLGVLNGQVEEIYSGHHLMKAYGRERQTVAVFSRCNDKLYQASWKAQFLSGLVIPLVNLINHLSYVVVGLIGGIYVVKGVLQVGELMAFIAYAWQILQPVAQIAGTAGILQSGVASAGRVLQVLEEAEEPPDPEDAKAPLVPRGEVQFEDVSFAYREDVPLLEHLHFAVRPGQKVAIVGPTGAGKTTLVNLLMRFYDIKGGKITVDGNDIRQITRGSLRRYFGMVLQDSWLFHGTIKDNIAYGRPATEGEVVSAAKAAHADHFIRTLPAGYDTVINEDASIISHGQRQLITIARAILADPAMLILDEATSNVDSRTELLIQKALTGLMKGRTSFVIAHRLSTVRDADLILLMDKGRIVEQGPHHLLLSRGGLYADLYAAGLQG